ncbi:MAG: ABC transporter substrate-binding protein [Actinomycetota bacterium]|nr:ABC transporter substrate-binding protein [Actinomycetota bacterium]
MKVTASGIVVASGGTLVAACGGGSSATQAATSGGTPKRGGTLRVGAQGGANTDTLDAHNVLTNTDFARLAQLYDPLVRLNDQGQPQLVLAESVTPNKDATEWTIRIRKGVITHDGKPFGAKDVLFSVNRIITGKFPGTYSLGPINLKRSKVLDDHTLLLRFDKPYSILLDGLSLHHYIYMVPIGYNPKQPIGTGPFKLKSFTPGRESTVVRHTEYWDHPKPYLDSVVTTNINDETAQVNGLQSGQVDAIDYLTAASIAALQGNSNINVIVSKTGGWVPFTMRVDRAPYSDVRVRQALKLVIDRPKMLEGVFAGHGQIGNDVFGIYDKNFDKSLLPQRVQDLGKARSLLQQAGQPNLAVQLITTPNAPGMVQAAQVFKTQAAAAGVNTAIVNQPVTDYFARSYLKVPFSEDYWPYLPYLVTVSQDSLKGAPFSATKFDDPTYNQLFAKATSTLDPVQQRDAVHQMLKIDYDQGGNIIPFFFPVIDAVSSKVHGVGPSVTGQALRTFQFKEFWIS